MLVLGIESSTPVASVALVDQKGLVGEITLNTGLTHSEQLLPLIVDLLEQTRLSLEQVEGIAIAGGPGSFTGLRIGMATAKALAQGRGIPLISVPTLQALAYTQCCSGGLVSPVMNARRNEVYTALFRFGGGQMEQLVTHQAIAPQEWSKVLAQYAERVVLVGDAIEVYHSHWAELGDLAVYPPAFMQGVRAGTVAWLGRQRLEAGERDDLYSLKPLYIRPVDAQVRLACPR